MTDEEKKLITETPITMDCFEMGDFEPMYIGLYCSCRNANITDIWKNEIGVLEYLRIAYNETKDERYLKELIRLLPNSYKVVKL